MSIVKIGKQREQEAIERLAAEAVGHFTARHGRGNVEQYSQGGTVIYLILATIAGIVCGLIGGIWAACVGAVSAAVIYKLLSARQAD